VTATTFNAAGQPLNVQLTGSTPDQDIYTYDPSTGRMKTFEFEVGNTPKNLTGTLTWNANGTLGQLAIVDGFNAGGTQTCNFNPSVAPGTGYDDLGRLVGVDCGSGQWGQTFSYDIYDNLSKSASFSGRIGTTWLPGYSPTTNHCNVCTYDADGNVEGDGNNVYGWNQYSKLQWTATSGTPTCGTSGRCATYDAFGRIVEQSIGSTYRERWITQLGETAYMTGLSPIWAYWSAPGGGRALVYGNSTNIDFLHPDWLGNARIDSYLGNHTVTTDQAYTPYAELYDIFGSNVGQNEVFAGLTGNFAPGATSPVMWDTPNRELSMVGRWLSPDPAGAGWNQYAYPTNPNSETDPSGAFPAIPQEGVIPPCYTCSLVQNNDVASCQNGTNLDGGGACAQFIGSAFDWANVPFSPTGKVATGSTPLAVTSSGDILTGQAAVNAILDGNYVLQTEIQTYSYVYGNAALPLIAQNLPPGMNGPAIYSKWATRGMPKVTNPPGTPGPPEPPPDLGGRDLDAIEKFEKMMHALMLMMENGEIPYMMMSIMPDAEACAILKNCGGNIHQF